MKKIKIGLIGFGTIGTGLVKALMTKRRFLKEKAGLDIIISRICDKDLKKRRGVDVDRRILTRSISKVLYDPEIAIVVELIGGIYPAKDIIMEALRQGKHVVTANKALLSQAGDEIFALAGKLGLSVGFEASVGGGIPIVRSLKEGFVADRIDLIYGIINGTSNFILSKMAEEGLGFDEALKLAQRNGYAEKDPSFDIDGIDSAHKLSILALLGFGFHVKPKDIYTEGISDIEPSDIMYAKEHGYAIKLLAIAKRVASEIEVRVHPTLIGRSHLLANITGVYNGIFVKGDLIGESLFYGEGAGAHPTSSAVLGDIIAIARSTGSGAISGNGAFFQKDIKNIRNIEETKTRYYVRFSALDKPGVLAKISGILGKHGIGIATVIQKERKRSGVVPVVMLTHEAVERHMAAALKEIDRLSVIRKKTIRVRIEG